MAMTLQARLAKLERSQSAQPADPVVLGLTPDLEARIEAAMLAGPFLQSLTYGAYAGVTQYVCSVSVVKRAFSGAQASRFGPKFNRMSNKGARKTVDSLSDGLAGLLHFWQYLLPVRGLKSFLAMRPWQCHLGAIQSEEVLGYDGAIGQDGWPVDPKHPSAK